MKITSLSVEITNLWLKLLKINFAILSCICFLDVHWAVQTEEAVLPESLNKKSPNFWKPQKTYIKAILKSQKTYQRPPKSQKYLHQSSKNYAKNLFKQAFSNFFEK